MSQHEKAHDAGADEELHESQTVVLREEAGDEPVELSRGSILVIEARKGLGSEQICQWGRQIANRVEWINGGFEAETIARALAHGDGVMRCVLVTDGRTESVMAAYALLKLFRYGRTGKGDEVLLGADDIDIELAVFGVSRSAALAVYHKIAAAGHNFLGKVCGFGGNITSEADCAVLVRRILSEASLGN